MQQGVTRFAATMLTSNLAAHRLFAQITHQLETTRNLKLPRVLRFFFVGLDYQVEHHLFPKITHQELPRAEKVVKAWCERVGVPHLDIGYGDAVVEVTVFMRDAWKTPALTGAEARGERTLAAA